MTNARMTRLLDPADQLAWLPDGPDDAGWATGFDRHGWEDSTWVLHAIWEQVGGEQLTHDERRRQRIEAGEVEPTVTGGVNLDEMSVDTGVTLGYRRDPGSGWSRLRWADLAGRMGFAVGQDRVVPPSNAWFPISSWQVAVQPPTEGSLDETSLRAVLEVLAVQSDPECYAFYAAVPTGDFDTPTLMHGPLDAVPELVTEMAMTPSNLWPADRSWLVYTDWDLWATRVSGPPALIRAIEAHPDLETVRWSPGSA
ncbi:hypothetical protein [Kibdelosporangium phytohabitans]|uniref:Uncharacterized protein n=1 Tax=Kibdelosporangium phytohabitans TaxID=860235 RepID=A0A0N9HRQ9_9PSEU|nr:hypothetical protein [Kibdelosporangium phytohabitans]ALG09868.1 hypothetical protein AOZ06_25875 [Kibdelosporangium phytohabitans]MBE1468735.1 hypothetical protein [Kibdelosporangium phytohabitans]